MNVQKYSRCWFVRRGTLLAMSMMSIWLLPYCAIKHFRYDVLFFFVNYVLGVPLFISGLIFLFLACAQNKKQKVLDAMRCFIPAAIIAFHVQRVESWRTLRDHAAQEAQDFCMQLIPLLEQEKKQTGKYPESIEPLLGKFDKIPYLLRGRKFYKLDSDGNYTFSSRDEPWTPITSHWWVYHGVTGQWDGGSF